MATMRPRPFGNLRDLELAGALQVRVAEERQKAYGDGQDGHEARNPTTAADDAGQGRRQGLERALGRRVRHVVFPLGAASFPLQEAMLIFRRTAHRP